MGFRLILFSVTLIPRVACRFSHPVAKLSSDAVLVNSGAGQVEGIISAGSRGSLCSDFVVRAKVPLPPGNAQVTKLNATILGRIVPDMFGLTFPTLSNTTKAGR